MASPKFQISPRNCRTPTNDGKTYVFKIRKGIKFSNGQELGVKDVVASLQRIFKVSSPTAGGFYSVIVGADKCLADPKPARLKAAWWAMKPQAPSPSISRGPMPSSSTSWLCRMRPSCRPIRPLKMWVPTRCPAPAPT